MTESLNGIILIDKPRGMTSHDVVDRLRRITRMRQIGHTGTLDPMADGLLILCLGRATRVSQFLLGLDKVYGGTITLGAISATYDAEGDITPQERPLPDGDDSIREAMATQLGERSQLPPPYSAIKVAGKKLYEYARNGEEIPSKPRPVRIHHFDLIRYLPPEIQFSAKVGSGTYIRSMAHDLGLALGCGGYLSQLRRTHIGAFTVDQAVPLEALLAEPELVISHLMSLTEGLTHLPKVTIHPRAEKAIMNGRTFTTGDIMEFDGILRPGAPVLVLDSGGRVLSIAQPEMQAAPEQETKMDEPGIGEEQMLFKPLRVLARD